MVLYIVPQVFGKSSYRLGEYELVLSFVLIGGGAEHRDGLRRPVRHRHHGGLRGRRHTRPSSWLSIIRGNVGLIPMLVIGAAVGG